MIAGARVRPSSGAVARAHERARVYSRRSPNACHVASWRAYDDAAARRGTVIVDLSTGSGMTGRRASRVQWDDGAVSDSLDSVLDVAMKAPEVPRADC